MQTDERTELQQDLEDNPALAATYHCMNCGELIGDADYRVDAEGLPRHSNCLRAAVQLINMNHLPPDTPEARQHNNELAAAIRVIVDIGRAHGLLPEGNVL